MKLYEVGCIVKEVQPKNGEKISLEEAQALVIKKKNKRKGSIWRE